MADPASARRWQNCLVRTGQGTRSLAIRGPFRGVTGHDHHTREFVRELGRQGIRIQLTDIPRWHRVKLSPEDRDPWFEQLGGSVGADAALHFCMPHQVVTNGERLTVNYTMFEASPAPADWIARGRGHDLVIVPTRSSRDMWLAGGHPPARIRTCPLGVDVDRFHPGGQPLELSGGPGGRPVADYRVRMLHVSEPQPRKNLVGLVRTWITATSPDDDAILIVKLSVGGREPVSALMRELALMQHEVGRSMSQAAPVLFVGGMLAEAEMPRLYAAASHYWSMSYGEGWDLPMAEAAATGLRLIVPRHTAYLDYLDDDVARMIPSRMVPADASGVPWAAELFGGTSWWVPDEEAAGQALRDAIEGRDRPAASVRDRVVSSLTWRHAAARLIEILAELHAEHGRQF
jgi:glycosyltransferase involved in cell wall biosynthesis